MTERDPNLEHCSNCPNRSKISKMLAHLAEKNELAPDCKGPVRVSHGVIETRIRKAGEPRISRKDFHWNSMIGSTYNGGEERYSRTEWTTEDVCGREPIEPREGEVPYSLSRPTWTNEDGSHHVAFISGDDTSLKDHYGAMATMELLDAVSEMQAAEDEGDVAGIEWAQEKIEKHGFSVAATAGRRDGKKK